MVGIVALDQLLKSMRPVLAGPEFVFCSVPGHLAEYVHLEPLATYREPEGLTLVVERSVAEQHGLAYHGTFRCITLTVHSSLEAVGLTAAVATKLAAEGISANVMAAYYHDHIFVQTARAEDALAALQTFCS